MSLRNRLDTLRRQSGATPDATPRSPPMDVARRVQQLRGHAAARPARKSAAPEELARALGGERVDEALIHVVRQHPLGSKHGGYALQQPSLGDAAEMGVKGGHAEDLLFFDTETSGLAGGTGTIAFLVGLARYRNEALEVHQFMITAFGGEDALFRRIRQFVDEAGVLISFNGKAFDLPLLKDRSRLQGETLAAAHAAHVDLLHATRRAFASRWPDCRLATVERRLLGFERVNDLPGWEVPQVWFDYLQRGDIHRLPAVAEHNRWDLVSLAALLPALDDVYREPGRFGADPVSIARHRLRSGAEEEAIRLLEAHESELPMDGRLELSRIYRRREQWDLACAIWEELVEEGCAEAAARLAKYHEHVRRNLDRALGYTRRLPPGEERERRLRRLLAKRANGRRTPELVDESWVGS